MPEVEVKSRAILNDGKDERNRSGSIYEEILMKRKNSVEIRKKSRLAIEKPGKAQTTPDEIDPNTVRERIITHFKLTF